MANALQDYQEHKPYRKRLRKEAVMKTLNMLITMMASTATVAYAATEAQGEGMGILAYLFLGFLPW